VDLANSTFVIGNKETVDFREIGDSLRRAEAGDGMDSLSFPQVEDFDRVVAERAHEQSFIRGVEIEVVDPSLDARQRDCLLQLQRLLLRVGRGWIKAERCEQGAVQNRGSHLLA